MGKDGCSLFRCEINWPALAYRVADATRLLDKGLLWLLTADNAPKINTDFPSEVVLSERNGVGVIQSEISESIANVRCNCKLAKFTKKEKSKNVRL